MLAELYSFLTTPCSKFAKDMGYLEQSIAIDARYKRCAKSWQKHLDNSKQAILDAANNCSSHRKVVILGSGSLYDIPCDDLTKIFNKVELVDIVHPKKTIKIAKSYPNIMLRTHDLSGINYSALNLSNNYTPQILNLFLDDKSVDLIVSANLLSQLPVLPSHFLPNKFGLSPDHTYKIGQKIVSNHLSYIDSFNGTKCIISDKKRKTLSKDNDLLEEDDALLGIEIDDINGSWTWDIAPKGEQEKTKIFKNEVIYKIY